MEGAIICTVMARPYSLSSRTALAALAIPAAAAVVILLNVHKTPTSPKSHKESSGRLSMYGMTAPGDSSVSHLHTGKNYPHHRRDSISRWGFL